MKKVIIPISILFGAIAYPACAIDKISFNRGKSTDNQVEINRLSISWDSRRKWLTEGDWHVVSSWQLDLGYWESSPSVENTNSLVDLGITPLFRLVNKTQSGLRPWLEGAIGAHLISETTIGDIDLSSTFQFGSHIAAGIRFGSLNKYDLAYRFQHLSNGGLKGKNDGINFHLISLGYHF